MTSDAKTVDEYFETIPEKRMEAMQKLRELCLIHLAGYEETMTYKMPCYKKDGKAEIAFNSQKQYISVYIMKHEVMLNNADRLANINCGKGCIRFPNPNKIDFELIADLLKESVDSDAEAC